jgi:hypothetical protein
VNVSSVAGVVTSSLIALSIPSAFSAVRKGISRLTVRREAAP